MAAVLGTISGRNDRSVIMDEEKKKQINEAIAVLREECKKHEHCFSCPFERSGCPYDMPCDWEDIE